MPYLTLEPETGRITRDQYSLGYVEILEYDELQGWKKKVRRIRKNVRRIAKRVGRKAHYVSPTLFIAKFIKDKKFRGRIRRAVKAAAPIVLPIAGAVLAPFTGGASALAAGLVTKGQKMYNQRKAAIAAEKAGKAEAAAMAAEEAAYSKKLEAQADKLYAENTNIFVQNGYPPEKWKTYDVDMKLAVIDRINKAAKQEATPPKTVAIAAAPKRKDCPPSPPTPHLKRGKVWRCIEGKWRVVSAPPKAEPTYIPIPVDRRTAPRGKMGDPATAHPVTAPGCPPGYVAQMEDYMGVGETFAHYGPVATSVRFGGAGGYIISKPTPRQKIFMGSTETADLIAPGRQRKVDATRRSYGLWKMGRIRTSSLIAPPKKQRRVNATRRSHGLWKIAPWSKAGLLEGLGQEDAAVEDIKARLSEIGLNLRDRMVFVSNKVDAVLRTGASLPRISGLAYSANKMLQTVKREWYDAGLHEKLEKADPSLAQSIYNIDLQLANRLRKLVQIERAKGKQPIRVAAQYARQFWRSIEDETAELGDDLRRAREGITAAIAAAGAGAAEFAKEAPGWIWWAGAGALALVLVPKIFGRR